MYIMRNEIKTTKKASQHIMALIARMPYFSLDNLRVSGVDRHYLRVFLSRQVKAGRVIRLKRGLYVSQRYIDEAKMSGKMSPLLEFFACVMYQPAYLSGEYVLYEHNILTDIPQNFTLITRNKTARFSNALGNFIYHSVSERLFKGFKSARDGSLIISKATKAKALFDFLYLRKDLVGGKKEFDELRLNLGGMTARDKKELKTYIALEGSAKMKYIYSLLD